MHSVFLPSNDRTVPGVRPVVENPARRIEPLPHGEWPAWTLLLELARQPSDTGLGDTIVHVIGETQSERFKRWFHEKFGRSCGCTERQRWLNQKFAYLSTGSQARHQREPYKNATRPTVFLED